MSWVAPKPGGSENLGGGRPVVWAAWTPESDNPAVDHDRVTAELARVLLGAGQVPAGGDGTAVDGEGPRRVDPPPRRPAYTQPAVELSRRVRQHEPAPPQVAGNGAEPISRAEADRHQSHVLVPTGRVHLDQVLLAWQSMSMSQEYDDVDADQRSECQFGTLELGERQVSDIDCDVLRSRHGVAL